jgi:hypothetical protein
MRTATDAEMIHIAIMRSDFAHVASVIFTAPITTIAKAAAMSPIAWSEMADTISIEFSACRCPWNQTPAAVIASAPGSCHTTNVTKAPPNPPNVAPKAVASWVEPDPGRADTSAKSSTNVASCRNGAPGSSGAATYLSYKSATCATEPPNDTKPNGRNDTRKVEKDARFFVDGGGREYGSSASVSKAGGTMAERE